MTGWHAVVVIGGVLALFTLLQVYTYTSSSAAVNAFDQAPLCRDSIVEPGCKTRALMWLTVDSSNSRCYLQAHPQTTKYPYYSGEFSTSACSGVSNGSHALVEIWQGILVHVTRLTRDDWATNSSVGKQTSAIQWILIMLVVDTGFALLVVLYFIFWVMGRGRRS